MKAVLLIALTAGTMLGQARARKPVKPVPAAPAANPGLFPLRRIQVTGNRLLTATQIQAVAGLPLEKPLGKADFDAARDRLLATGYFESVAFQFGPIVSNGKPQGYEARFEVAEVPTVYPVAFENLPVDRSAIEADLKAQNLFYGPKIPATELVLGHYARQIEQFLASRNHPTRVMAEVIQPAKDEFQVLFRSAEPLPPVAHVTFLGNHAISAITLQNAINNVAFGSPFSRDHFNQLLDHQVRPLYEAKGMIRVAFPLFTTEPAPQVKGVLVHVTVEEGPVYALSKTGLTGADPDYLDYVKVKPGSPVNFDQLNEGLEAVKNQMKRNGYLEVQGMLERKIDDRAHTVEVTLLMTPGPQYSMGKLTIAGLDLNSEPVVRKLWIVAEGNPFNASYPDYFLKRIREDGLFDGLGSTTASKQVDEQTHVVDVTLNFGSSPKPKPRRRPGSLNDDPPSDSTKPVPPIG